MGLNFIDRFSLLHFAVGIVGYFLNINLIIWIILNILFEIIENTQFTIRIIDNYLSSFCPGGKKYPDSIINSIGDILFATLGWIFAYLISNI